MNLTDVVSHAGFSGYAQIGFVISLAAFWRDIGGAQSSPGASTCEAVRISMMLMTLPASVLSAPIAASTSAAI